MGCPCAEKAARKRQERLLRKLEHQKRLQEQRRREVEQERQQQT